MSNVTGLVFKSHFRLNIIIFICNVILSLLFGTSQSEKPRRRKTALLQMSARPKTRSDGRRLQMSARRKRRVAMDECYKWTTPTNGCPTNGRTATNGPAENRRRGQPSAEEDNRPPKRTTVRRRGQPTAEEDNRPPKRTTENWTLSNRPGNTEQPSIGTDAEQPSIGTDAEQPSIGTAL